MYIRSYLLIKQYIQEEYVMKNTIRLVVVCTMVLLSAGLMASNSALANTNTGIIAYIAGANGPIAYVTIASPPNGYAACAQQNRYVIDISSPGGRSMYSIALTAKATGQQVTIVGSGTCNTLPGDAEDVLNVITAW